MSIYSGWINIDKPYSISSAKAVSIIRSLLKVKKVGHAGTLDPLATGVLPIAIGDATKTISFIQNDTKEYVFDLKFGCKTDTADQEGKIIATTEMIPSSQDLLAIISNFQGNIEQKPPIYSAIKVNGKRAYELARKGIIPDIKKRPITIYKLSLINFDKKNATARFNVKCSKGTYIRSLAEDIAEKLNSYGHVISLRRVKVGKFCEKNIISLESLKQIVHNDALKDRMLSIFEVLDDIPVLEFSKEESKKLQHGMQIEVPNKAVLEDEYFLAKYRDTLLAIGKLNNGFFKPTRVFNLN